jgi:hypothetical protein
MVLDFFRLSAYPMGDRCRDQNPAVRSAVRRRAARRFGPAISQLGADWDALPGQATTRGQYPAE